MLLPSLSTVGILVVILPLLYIYTASVAQTRLPMLRGKRICLLIAHPDDEAMFFAPTVLALTRPELGNHVKILCLSSGNADGLGEIRKKELVKSALLLGLAREDDVLVYESPDFPDSMTTTWDAKKISALLTSAFAPRPSTTTALPKHPSSSSSSVSSDSLTPPNATVDAIVTFDSRGVSSHPNHISLYHGARAFVAALTRARPGWRAPVDLYTLTTVALPRKYAGFLDVFATVGSLALAGPGAASSRSDKGNPSLLVSVSALACGGRETYGAARRAMTEAHQSQMVWFRWGWIAMSRYMYINDLRLEKVKS
ncbi:LmbE-like protein [Daldinia caldariorum]|uniref:LmbE-like protein n=1 Tax=Daldinia caldariorum TaxID=326644 RepID=UPI0020076B3B|nr:LmbE-like protein [Daldinia caldariorum]KAI1465074.1 LmbE-like protein [Daldinia caldariorum]